MISSRRKVHIVPVAFEIDRAVLPVLEDGADKVYVLWGASEKSKPSTYAEKVRRKLEKRVRKVISVNFGFYDYPNIFSKLVEIGRAEKGNDVFINLSSGAHIVSIAGAFAASMFGWTPYYVEPDMYNINLGADPKGMTSGAKNTFVIQTYPIRPPDDDLVKCLKVLSGIAGGMTSQKSLLEAMEKIGLVSDIRDGKALSKRAQMEFKRRFVDPLLKKGWINKSGEGKRSRLEITEKGKEIAKIFG